MVERRLERIDRLRTGGGSRPIVLAEVRALLAEGRAFFEAERAREGRAGGRAPFGSAESRGGEAEVA